MKNEDRIWKRKGIPAPVVKIKVSTPNFSLPGEDSLKAVFAGRQGNPAGGIKHVGAALRRAEPVG